MAEISKPPDPLVPGSQPDKGRVQLAGPSLSLCLLICKTWEVVPVLPTAKGRRYEEQTSESIWKEMPCKLSRFYTNVRGTGEVTDFTDRRALYK